MNVMKQLTLASLTFASWHLGGEKGSESLMVFVGAVRIPKRPSVNPDQPCALCSNHTQDIPKQTPKRQTRGMFHSADAAAAPGNSAGSVTRA